MDSEDRIQQKIVQWYNNTYCLIHHNPRCMILSIPNSGLMSVGRAIEDVLRKLKAPSFIISAVSKTITIMSSKMKYTGLLPGASDLYSSTW